MFVEKAEEISVAKYDKIIVWIDGSYAQIRSRFVFRFLTVNFFDGTELTWNYNEKSHGKGPMDDVGGTVKNIIFCKVKSGFVTIDSPFELYQAILKFAPSIKSVYSLDTDVLNKPENIEQESKKIPKTLKVHHVEKFEVKGVYDLKLFYLAEDMRNLLTPNGIQTGKMLSIAGTRSHMLMTATVLSAALKSVSKEKKSGYSVGDCVSGGITNSVFSISLLFKLFLIVYWSFLLK